MPDALLAPLLILLALAVGCAFLGWAVRMERRAQARESMARVYYLRPRMRDDVPEWKRIDVE